MSRHLIAIFLRDKPTIYIFAFATASVLVAVPDIGFLMALPLLMMQSASNSERATVFEGTLPLPARHLFLLRTLTTIAFTWIPVLAWIVTSLVHWSATQARQTPSDIALTTKIAMLGVCAVAAILPNIVSPTQMRVPRVLSALIASSVLILGVLLVQQLTPIAALLMVTLSVVAAFHVAWNSLPQSFQLAPHVEKSAARKPTVEFHIETRADRRAQWWQALLRSCTSPAQLFLIAIIGLGVNSDMWILYSAVYGIMGVTMMRQRSSWMYGLPMSHRQFMLINFLPVVVPVVAGLALGTLLYQDMTRYRERMSNRSPYVAANDSVFTSQSQLAFDFWKLAPRGNVPGITAPWGESSAAATVSIYGMRFYNPYSAQKNNSQQFTDWQFARATEAVYGQSVGVEQYDNGTHPRRVTGSLRMFVLGAGLFSVFVMFAFTMLELGRAHFVARRRKLWYTAIALGVAPILVITAGDMYYDHKLEMSVLSPLARGALLQISRALPDGILPVLLVAAVPAIAMFFLLEWLFKRSEFTDRPSQKTVR